MFMIKLNDLKKEIKYKWRQGPKVNGVAKQLAYIDARDVMNLLDEVCGPENWQDDYKEVNGQVSGGIGIRINDEWVWKWDTGAESNIEQEKGLFSDAFKRAGVKWGIGRFLYDLDGPKNAAAAPQRDTSTGDPNKPTSKQWYMIKKLIDEGKITKDEAEYIKKRYGDGKFMKADATVVIKEALEK